MASTKHYGPAKGLASGNNRPAEMSSRSHHRRPHSHDTPPPKQRDPEPEEAESHHRRPHSHDAPPPKQRDPEPEEAEWEQWRNDSLELRDLIFCLRRSTARYLLESLCDGLSQSSERARRKAMVQAFAASKNDQQEECVTQMKYTLPAVHDADPKMGRRIKQENISRTTSRLNYTNEVSPGIPISSSVAAPEPVLSASSKDIVATDTTADSGRTDDDDDDSRSGTGKRKMPDVDADEQQEQDQQKHAGSISTSSIVSQAHRSPTKEDGDDGNDDKSIAISNKKAKVAGDYSSSASNIVKDEKTKKKVADSITSTSNDENNNNNNNNTNKSANTSIFPANIVSSSSIAVAKTPKTAKASTKITTTNMARHFGNAAYIELPTLKDKDKWIQYHCPVTAATANCQSFEVNNACRLGLNCTRLHIYRLEASYPIFVVKGEDPTEDMIRFNKDDLIYAYKKFRSAVIPDRNLLQKSKADEIGRNWFARGLNCPIDGTMYFAHGGEGNRSAQNIWWYSSSKAAVNQVATIVIDDLMRRCIVPKSYKGKVRDLQEMHQMQRLKELEEHQAQNMLPILGGRQNCGRRGGRHVPIPPRSLGPQWQQTQSLVLRKPPTVIRLPDISPPNWMEPQGRCNLFNNEPPMPTCRRGSACCFAHVYFPSPTSLQTNRVPRADALRRAYVANFGITLDEDSAFAIKEAQDNYGTNWYTAAFRCPRENTVYYAAGGVNGEVNQQNIFLYPTSYDAKLAVSALILASFTERGMQSSWP